MNLHSPSKSNTKYIVYKFLALFWYVCILRLDTSTHVYFAKNVAYFPFNSWFSFQRLCRLLWGFLIKTVWARECCRISPPGFLAECCKRQLNQGSFVLLYFRLFTFSDLYWVYLLLAKQLLFTAAGLYAAAMYTTHYIG